jgi:acetolactate synthase-1/2/3 large subunit
MPLDVEGRDSGYLHEAKNQAAAVDNIVNWSHRVRSHEDLALTLYRAFEDLSVGRSRPVHIEVPLDILQQEGPVGMQHCRTPVGPVAPASHQIRSSVDALLAGQRRALLLGGGCRAASDACTRLADRLNMAIVTTMNGKGVVSELHPLSIGASIVARATQHYLDLCDVVLAVGTEVADSDLFGGSLHPSGTFIRVDVDPAQLHKNVRADIVVQGDARLSIEGILQEIEARAGSDECERVSRGREEMRRLQCHDVARVKAEVADELVEEMAPWQVICSSLAGALSDDAIVAGDAAMVCYNGAGLQLPLVHPRQWLYPTGFCTLGYGLPAGVGAKLAYPARQVVVLMGDGGLMFTLGEIATAAALGLAIPIVVVCNGGYGEIRREMVQMGIRPIGTDLPVPDFTMVARGLGAHGVAVAEAEVGEAVAMAFGADRPTVVQVQVA